VLFSNLVRFSQYKIKILPNEKNCDFPNFSKNETGDFPEKKSRKKKFSKIKKCCELKTTKI
jgi:hypothetical protein